MNGKSGRAAKFPLRLEQMDVKPGKPAPAPSRELLRPQRPLQHAADESARRNTPTGLGLDSADVRRRMVDRLRNEGLQHESVLEAMATVPRHQFVDAALATQAYEDTSLPIGHGQTISKPSVVARMIGLMMCGANSLAAGRMGRILEIGTGCGYQAAVLSRLSRQVFSIERVKPLHDKARELMGPLRISNVRLVYGDGMLGHAPNAPYDGIIAAAGGEQLPPAWMEQLAVGGRLVAPVHDGADRQVLVVVDRKEQGFERSIHEVVQFVPLKSGLVR